MGWLKDLMSLAEPPVPSFGRLAAACLEHTEWPEDAELKPRSLATLFSKLDRHHDLDWLRDRADVQLVISRVLGRPLGDLKAALGEPEHALEGRLIRLHAARYARELDLSRESLPPGIPTAVCSPPLWGPSVWVAPSGSGRTLVGQWLRARGLAQFLTVRDRADLAQVPARGPVFVEVTRRVGVSSADLDGLGGRRRPVCVAMQHPPAAHDWSLITSPSAPTYLSALIDWLVDRLDGTGHLNPERAEQWMRRVALPRGVARTFGDTLGLLGMLDETTPKSISGRGLDELAETYVKRRVKDASLDTSWGPRVAETAYPALRRLAARCHVTEDADLDLPRTLGEWTELLAQGDEVAPDEEWFVHALLGRSEVSQRELERAARRLPPSGYQIARSLSLAGLLRRPSDRQDPHDDELSVLGPRFLVSILEERASSDALAFSAGDWGMAVLDPERRPSIEQALRTQLQAGNLDAVELLVEAFDESSPAMAAALDASVRLSADALLDGQTFPDGLVEGLLELVAENIVSLAGDVRPTLTVSSLAAWQAALCALTRDHRFPIAALDPHRAAARELRARFARSCCQRSTETGHLGYLSLADELTPRGAREREPLLQAVDALLTANAQGDSRELPCPPSSVAVALRYAARKAGPSAYARFFQFVPISGAGELLSDDTLERELWMNCPLEVLLTRHQRGHAIRWNFLLPHHFVTFLEAGQPLPAAAIPTCPEDALQDALHATGPGALSPEALVLALNLMGPELVRPLAAWLPRLPLAQAEDLLAATPARAAAHLAGALPPLTELLLWPHDRVVLVQKFLSDCVLNRVPGYRSCFERQAQLRRALRPLLR